MPYKVQKLVEEKFDFDTLYPDAQISVRQQMSVNYSMNDIVEFLRSQTNNFKDEYPLALDLDRGIYRIYEKKKEAEAPPEEAVPEKEEAKPTPKVLGQEELIKKYKGYIQLHKIKKDESYLKKANSIKTLLRIKYKVKL